jgi:hypothetical protein
MSDKKEIIEIQPQNNCKDEELLSRKHTCPHCNGFGWLHANETKPGEPDLIKCPVCHGTKKVQAYIKIEWHSSDYFNDK